MSLSWLIALALKLGPKLQEAAPSFLIIAVEIKKIYGLLAPAFKAKALPSPKADKALAAFVKGGVKESDAKKIVKAFSQAG